MSLQESEHIEISKKFSRALQVLELSKRIHSTLNIDSILETFLNFTVRELEAEGGTIYYLDRTTKTLESRHIISKIPVDPIRLQIGQGLAGRVAETGEHIIAEDTGRTDRFSDVIDRKTGYTTRNSICFPLKDETREVIGVIQLVNKRSGEFDGDDVNFLMDISHFTSMAIKNAEYHEDSIIKVRMEQEMKVAAEIQNKILPHTPPSIDSFSVKGFFQPCYETAGDYYNFYSGDKKTYCVLMDVSGKGVGAAMVASSIHTFMTLKLRTDDSLEQIASRLNEFMYSTYEGEKYATGVILSVDQSGLVTCLSAGHPPILKIGPDASSSYLRSTSPPFGLLPDMPFKETRLTISEGDILCIYSDGYNETPDQNDEEYGEERLMETFISCRESELDDMIESMNEKVRLFQGDRPNHDDRTMIVVKRNGR